MKGIKLILACMFIALYSLNIYGQCNHTLFVNSFDATCNGNGMSTVNINVTVLFGSGNNSATICYNIGAGEVVAEILEDDAGDIIDQTYTFVVPSCDNFTVTLKGWTNPSGSGSMCSDPAPVIAPIVLPVEFGEFEVRLNDSRALLNWNTYSEINNRHFEVQRSFQDSKFETMGIVSASSNSHDIKEYEFSI